jgi:hypothetical protein
MSAIVGPNTVSTDATTFVAPFYANMDVSANSELNVAKQQTVTMKYDLSFNVTLTEADSAKLVNSFVLHQDASGALVADISNNEEFRLVIHNVIKDATNSNTKGLATALYDNIMTDLSGVYGDDIANQLQSNFKLTVLVDASGGALNLWNDFAAEPEYATTIALQVPNSNYLAYCDVSENIHTNALPLLNGDKLVFLFSVETETKVYEAVALNAPILADHYGASTTAAGLTAPGGESRGDAAPNSYTPVVNTVTKEIQAVAFYVTVTGTGSLGSVDPGHTPSVEPYSSNSTLITGVRVAHPEFDFTDISQNETVDVSGNSNTYNVPA